MQSFIVEFKNALTAEYCQQLINKFEASKQTYEGRTGGGVDKSKKDSLDLCISRQQDWQQECNVISDLVLKGAVQYARQYPFILTGALSPGIMDPQTKQTRTITYQDIEQLNDQNIEHLIRNMFRPDEVNLQRYTKGKGGYHHWHSEHYPHPNDPAQRSLHRVLLWLIYLNDIESGGETEFFYQQTKIKPTTGSLILAPCSFTHTHRGHVPESSDKYVLASWMMYAPAAELYPKSN